MYFIQAAASSDRLGVSVSYELRPITRAVIRALGAGMVASAIPVVYGQQPQRVEKIEVTGSAIPRTTQEGPAPVEIVTRKDIERTGATNVNELLRSLSTIDIFDQGELTSNSPAGSGTSNIAIRGLSGLDVLVLLNGRRLPVNALYDSSGAGASVDVNMIPISAIERVEILKDGGSAIYGADAVAGVVNFITRKNYQGIEARAGYGISSRNDGEEKSLGLSAGFGDLDANGFNVLAAFDLFKREEILRKDRDISKSSDFRRFGGGDGRSSFAPEGNILDDDGAFTGETVLPCPPEKFRLRCRYDFNASLLTGYNGADRWGGMLVGTMKLGSDIRLFTQLFYSQAKDHFEAHPVPDFFVLPDGRFYAGRFMQGGPRITDRKSKLDEEVVGVEGSTKWFDWNVAGGQGRSRVENKDRNYYNADLWFPALESGQIDGTSLNNDPALVESLKVKPVRTGESKVRFIDGKLNGELFQMPAGPLGYAVGASAWRETLVDTPDPLSQQGLVVGSIQQAAVNASRSARAVFAELSIPVLSMLEMQVALRHDRYPNDSKTSPKVAFRFQPMKELLLRASYSESFRVPSLKQLFGALEEGATTIDSAEECAIFGLAENCGVPAFVVQGSNPDLKPEKGTTWNIGAVADLGPFSGSLDFWHVKKEDNIDTPTVLQALQGGFFTRDASGRINVFTNLQNFAQAESQGIDLDLKIRGNTPFGALTLRNSATYYDYIRKRQEGNPEWEYYQGTYATPRWRNTFSTNLESGWFAVAFALRSVGGFADTDAPWKASEPTGADVRHVGSYDEADLILSYLGVKNLKIDLGVKNLADRQPPFSNTNGTSNLYTQQGFAELYNSRGRFYFGSVSYAFK